MTFRMLLGKLAFPLLFGIGIYVWLWSWDKRTQRSLREAQLVQQHVDARVITAMPRNYTNCGIRDWGEKPVDVDGDPRHASAVLWTRLDCSEGSFTMWGRLPKLVTR